MVEGTKLSLYGDSSPDLLAAYPHCVQIALHFISFSQLKASHLAKVLLALGERSSTTGPSEDVVGIGAFKEQPHCGLTRLQRH